MGKVPGLSAPSHASVQADRSWRAGLPVRPRDRTVWRDRASTIFSRKMGEVSASWVASQTEPVQAPAAPMAMQAAICRPVMMPPAAAPAPGAGP